MFEEYFKDSDTKQRFVKRNEILQIPGQKSTKAFYVKKGLLRSYLIDDNGKVHIFVFAPEGWIISNVASQTFSGKTELYVDAIEDSEIIEINQISAETFTNSGKNNDEIIKKLFRRIAVLQKRVTLLMSAPAKERYEHFISTYPQLVKRVPLKMIASYLGITPEALSNIRSKIRNQ